MSHNLLLNNDTNLIASTSFQVKIPLSPKFGRWNHFSTRECPEHLPSMSIYERSVLPAGPYGWAPNTNDQNQWILASFPEAVEVTHIITHPRNFPSLIQWITEFNLYYINSQKKEILIGKFPGNTDATTPRITRLSQPVVAYGIKLQPLGWHNHILLRWQIFGVKESEKLRQSLQTLQLQSEQYQRDIKNLNQQIRENNNLLETKAKEIQKLEEMQINENIQFGNIKSDLLKSFGSNPRLFETLFFSQLSSNVAFIGRVSGGKSTLINALTGQKGAQVGFDETTKLPPFSYTCPTKFPNVVFWDFAGVGGTKSDYANPENRQYIFLLSKMDVICVVHDGVFDTSARQTINFVKEFPNKKLLLFNKVDRIVEDMVDDEQVGSPKDALRFLAGEASALRKLCNAEKHFLISARNAKNNRKKIYDWDNFCFELKNLKCSQDNNNCNVKNNNCNN